MLREVIRLLGPGWLVRDELPDGTECDNRVLYAIALVLDAFLQRRQDGVQAAQPSTAPDDALPRIARDRLILRGPNESRDALVVRLNRAITDHRTKGNAFTLQEQVRGYLSPHLIRSATVDQRGTWKRIDRDGTRETVRTSTWAWDGVSLAAARTRWWLIVYPTTDVPKRPWAKSAPWGATGKVWGTPKATWGSTATSDEIAGLRLIARSWKPAGTGCLWIIVCFVDASAAFAPATPGPDGTWGNWSKNQAGTQVRARSADGIYIRP